MITDKTVARHGGVRETFGVASDDVFAFRYGVLRPILTLIGFGPRFSRVVFHDHTLEVRFGYGFRADIPYSAIYNAKPEFGRIGGVGIHGWRGNWLVNGAVVGIVGFDLDQRIDARVLGLPSPLLHLRMSLEEPGRFLQRLSRESRLGRIS